MKNKRTSKVSKPRGRDNAARRREFQEYLKAYEKRYGKVSAKTLAEMLRARP